MHTGSIVSRRQKCGLDGKSATVQEQIAPAMINPKQAGSERIWNA